MSPRFIFPLEISTKEPKPIGAYPCPFAHASAKKSAWVCLFLGRALNCFPLGKHAFPKGKILRSVPSYAQ